MQNNRVTYHHELDRQYLGESKEDSDKLRRLGVSQCLSGEPECDHHRRGAAHGLPPCLHQEETDQRVQGRAGEKGKKGSVILNADPEESLFVLEMFKYFHFLTFEVKYLVIFCE